MAMLFTALFLTIVAQQALPSIRSVNGEHSRSINVMGLAEPSNPKDSRLGDELIFSPKSLRQVTALLTSNYKSIQANLACKRIVLNRLNNCSVSRISPDTEASRADVARFIASARIIGQHSGDGLSRVDVELINKSGEVTRPEPCLFPFCHVEYTKPPPPPPGTG